MKAGYFRANLILFVTLLGYGLTTALLSVYFSEQGVGLASIGLIFAVGAIIAGFLRVPIGVLVDCLGRKKFMILGLFGYPLFSIGLLYSTTVAHYTLLNLMVEILAAIFWTAHSAYIFDAISKGREGVEIAGRNVMMYIPAMVAPVFAGVIATNFGFSTLFMASAVISSLGILVALTLKDNNSRKKVCVAVMQEEYRNIKNIKGLKQIAAILMFGDFFLIFWGIFMPVYLLQQGISIEAIGLILTINILIGTLLQIPLGKAIDKWPTRNLLIPGFLLFSLGAALFFTSRNYLSYMISRILIGTGSDLNSWPAIGMLAKLTPKEEHGATTALVFGLDKVVMGFAALAAGILTTKYGISTVLTATSVMMLLAAIVLIPSKLLRQKGTQFHKLHHISGSALNVAHKHHK